MHPPYIYVYRRMYKIDYFRKEDFKLLSILNKILITKDFEKISDIDYLIYIHACALTYWFG